MPRSRQDWDEELAAGMLEDLEEITGIDIGEMMADEIEEPEERDDDFETFPVHDEPTESDPLDMSAQGGDIDEYFDELFDDIDVDAGEEDRYGDEGN